MVGEQPPLIVHAIHHLIMGGLENGLINLINHMPPDSFRHAIVCLDYFSDFRDRLERDDVEVYAMHRKPGKDPASYYRLWKLFRQLKPAIVHSRNLSGLDALVPAALAGVRCRIHGEHGWYDEDPDGSNPKYRLLRRLHKPFVNQYVALSGDLEAYLRDRIGVPQDRISRLYNGVDTELFQPGSKDRTMFDGEWLPGPAGTTVIGYVGRFQKIKDPMNLAVGFDRMLSDFPELEANVRLVMIGDGPERQTVQDFLADSGRAGLAWLPGARNDVAATMRQFDVFVLPSRGEGISNTILEAMATGLPVIATRVGGNKELVMHNKTGQLVPHSNPEALAASMANYVQNIALREQHGLAGRERAKNVFSLATMTGNYTALYSAALGL